MERKSSKIHCNSGRLHFCAYKHRLFVEQMRYCILYLFTYSFIYLISTLVLSRNETSSIGIGIPFSEFCFIRMTVELKDSHNQINKIHIQATQSLSLFLCIYL